MKKFTINDLDGDTHEQMLVHIRQDKAIQKLYNQRAVFIRQHRLGDAARMTGKIKEVEEKAINLLLQQYEGEAVRCGDLMENMPPEDVQELNVYLNGIIFLSDALETFSIEANGLLHRTHPDCNIEMYDTLQKLGKEAHRQMLFMANATNNIYQVSFAGEAERMQEMIRNKVRSFVRKVNKKEEDSHLKEKRKEKLSS